MKTVEPFKPRHCKGIIAKFNSGMSCKAIAEEYKVSYDKILTVLKINGVVKTTVDDTMIAKETIKYSINKNGSKHFMDYYGISRKEMRFYLIRENLEYLLDK